MIISRTPLRASFVGGGSDIASFYRKHKGAVVSTALDKYIYIYVSHQFDGRIIINYSKTEIVTTVDKIKNNLVREALKLTGIKNGIHIASIADIPSEGTGMGSSSAYIVGLLNALYAFQGKHCSAEKLAREACKIEIEILKKPIGKQDQYIAAYGGLQFIQFNPDETVFIDPIVCSAKTKIELQKKLLLFYTGLTRSADPILRKQNKHIEKEKSKKNLMMKMVQLAYDLKKDLCRNKTDSFGEYLHENWKYKKKMADNITNLQINKWYQTARKNGAIGGKLLGAGGGGFLLFYANAEKHDKIKRSLTDLLSLSFRFEPQGSKIIFIGN